MEDAIPPLASLVSIVTRVCADVTNHAAVWIIVGNLLNSTIAIHDHAVIAHIVIYENMGLSTLFGIRH